MLPPLRQKLLDVGNGANHGEEALAISSFNLYIWIFCQFSCSSTAEFSSFCLQHYGHTRFDHFIFCLERLYNESVLALLLFRYRTILLCLNFIIHFPCMWFIIACDSYQNYVPGWIL